MKRCWPAALLAACVATPHAHLGPITAATNVGERTFSCSQAGVFAGQGGDLQFVVDLGWRSFALAGRVASSRLPAMLMVGGGEPARNGKVALLTPEGAVLVQARIADDLVYAVAMSPTAALAMAGCADGRLVRLALPELSATATSWRHDGPVVAVIFSADGAWLASAGYDGKISLGPADADMPTVAIVDHTAAVTCLAWSHDHLLASGSRDGKLRLHDRTGRLLRVWQRLGGPVSAVAFAADGKLAYGIAGGPGVADCSGVVALP